MKLLQILRKPEQPPDILQQVLNLSDEFERGELQNITPDRIAAALRAQRLKNQLSHFAVEAEGVTV